MKHYIAVSLDVNCKNIVTIGFSTEKSADRSVEKLNIYNAQHGSVLSVDYYGHCEEQEVRSYYSNNVIQFIDRKNPLNNRAITAMGKSLLEAYNKTINQ